jgi:hypothetical protein
MSANYPPPSSGQNPYAQQPQQPPPGEQPQSPDAASPYAGGTPGAPAPGGFSGSAYAPPAPVGGVPQGNPGLGVALGIVAMIVGVFVFAGIMRAISGTDGHIKYVPYVALLVGAAVGAAVGKFGGRNPSLPIVAAGLAVLGVFLGEFVGICMVASHIANAHGGDISWFSLLTDHTGDVWTQYKHDFDFMTFLFLVLPGVEGFLITKRVAG